MHSRTQLKPLHESMASTKPPAPEILSDSDWSTRFHPTSFRRMIHVKHTPSSKSSDIYTSTSAAYPPTPSPRTYGGHVFAQAAWAASYTVPYGMHINSITGYFLLLGDTRYAFEYRVRRVRSGGVYALRQVEAYQNSSIADKGQTPVFIAYVSFKRDERSKHQKGVEGQRRDFGHQQRPRNWLRTEYGKILAKKARFEDWPLCQGMDGMWMIGKEGMSFDEWKQRGDNFPGLEMRKVDMSEYNPTAPEGATDDDGEAARRWRMLTLYRIVLDEEGDNESEALDGRSAHIGVGKKKTGADDILNLHACAHLYASDRNSIFSAQRALGFHDIRGLLGSLSHTVNFHSHASDWLMVNPESGRPKEYAQEIWTSNSGADRVCHNSRLWDIETGQILATTVQDGMMRIPVRGSKPFHMEDMEKRESKL